jgi:hypothetical protein
MKINYPQFLTALRARLLDSDCGEKESQVLDYLATNCLGRENARPLHQLCRDLQMNRNEIQNNVIVCSRKTSNRHFIGTCHKGVFVILDSEDVEVMGDFYTNRIAAEQTHRGHLYALAG